MERVILLHDGRFRTLHSVLAELDLMRKLRTSTLVRTIVVLMFALLMGEQGMLHACPLHTSVAGTERSERETSSHGAHDAQDAHDSHDAHSPGVASGDRTSHDGESHHTGCNCLGTCATAATVATPNIAVALVPAPEIVVRASRSTTYESPSYQPRATHRLPFSIGPPRLT